MERNERRSEDQIRELSRRDFLRYAGAGAVVLGGAGALAACGSSSSGTSSATSGGGGGGTPTRGGTLRVGVTGGGPSDTLDAQLGLQNADYSRLLSMFQPLVGWDLNMKLKMFLAESMEPDATAKTWTVKLRPGVEWHDGKTLNADDVIYSLNRVIKAQSFGVFALQLVDAPAMKKIDDLTVQIPMTKPYPSFPEYYASLYQNLLIVQDGYKPNKPVGTGPFKHVSFTPGQTSTMVRNPNYWESGKPYLDKLIITDYPDENSQINAFLSKQVDAVDLLSFPSIPRLEQADGKTVIGKTGVNTPFEMRVDQAPFSDVKVRQAMRLIIDRPQMLNLVFGGNGSIANDLFAPFDPAFDHSIPQRVQDIDQAKSLLKSAGQENLTVELVTAPIYAGVVESAQVFADQAKAAGITVNLKQVPVGEIFGPNYGKWTFSTQDYWFTNPYLPQVAQQLLPGSPFNNIHWNDPHYTDLYNQAFATTDSSLQTEIIHQMQQIDYDSGGLAIPYYVPIIDGFTSKLQGVEPGSYGFSFGNWSFENFWLS